MSAVSQQDRSAATPRLLRIELWSFDSVGLLVGTRPGAVIALECHSDRTKPAFDVHCTESTANLRL